MPRFQADKLSLVSKTQQTGGNAMITKISAIVTAALILSVASVAAATQKSPRQNDQTRPAATAVSFQNNWNVSY
jgi:hypothetical protein